MPFFRYLNSQQLRNLCQGKSLEYLKELNHRYGDNFEKINESNAKIDNEINSINQQINTILLKIEENKCLRQQADECRRNVLDNLPENPAERHLALQGISYFYDDEPSLKEELRKLEKQREDFNEAKDRLGHELHLCLQELKIVNAVIEEKELVSSSKVPSLSN
ncbi:hypothetical protein ACQUW5_14335 [Legionella sp. CNM-1927-20]|uniref:hypothetical protein n=1 Tax=Legionella sp. CNM-1927-20 TaxID=3422221 RepID=UPI00403B1155